MTSPATAATPPETANHSHSAGRIAAFVLRHYYLLRGSRSRLLGMIYWPAVNLVTWGYLNQYLFRHQASPVVGFGVLLAGALLWEMVQRSQVSVMFGTIEEMWARNLMQLFVSPLTLAEFLAGSVIVSFLFTSCAMLVCAVLVLTIFDFALFDLGWPFLAFYFMQLMTGWWVGMLLSAMLIRFGLGVEWLAWMAGVIIIPLAGAYYPVSVLPGWVQHISRLLPPTYIFEGMRQILQQQHFDSALLIKSFLLNLLYLAAAGAVFMIAFNSARRCGSLMQSGE